MSDETKVFEGWAILELMGHRRLAGMVSDVEIAGRGFIRLDVPELAGDGLQATQFYNPSAVYALTPTSEEIARKLAVGPRPAQPWELAPGLPASTFEPDADDLIDVDAADYDDQDED